MNVCTWEKEKVKINNKIIIELLNTFSSPRRSTVNLLRLLIIMTRTRTCIIISLPSAGGGGNARRHAYRTHPGSLITTVRPAQALMVNPRSAFNYTSISSTTRPGHALVKLNESGHSGIMMARPGPVITWLSTPRIDAIRRPAKNY